MPFETWEIIALVLLGGVAGTIGGLVGLGGSIIVIPGLTLLLHRDQHLAQAAAMILNVCIAVPSVVRHQKARAVPWPVVVKMLPVGIIFIIIGVESSQRIDGELLKKLFGCFLLYAMMQKILKLYRNREDEHPPRPTWPRVGLVGTVVGFLAGLLGIGGGPVAVPLLRRICHLPLRNCIATSSAVMCVTSAVGAYRKNSLLPELVDQAGNALSVTDSLWIVLYVAPPAVLGALWGAGLTHKLPLKWVRLVFIVFMIAAAMAMFGLFG